MGFLGYLLKSSTKEVHDSLIRMFAGERVFNTVNYTVANRLDAIRLTKRQLEALDFVRQGLGSKQISSAMCLSVGTVNNLVSNAVAALGAHSRTHAVAKAIGMGFLCINSNEA
ncbi:two-component system, NarL family, response regulator DesR [Variovorax sp. YR216]|nr:two-component system, NarL family, response regulator DesR [Variovorax sp. YR216]